MKAVILAGGLGTRISEESHLKPKPMIEIGGKPILWHIMKTYSHFGIQDFIICCGYKGYLIKEYFANYFLHNSDTTFDFTNNKQEIHNATAEPWKVTVVDTGEQTMTGGRLRRIKKYLDNEDFFFTYGDGLSNHDLHAQVEFHKKQKTLATVLVVQPPGRFGALQLNGKKIKSFYEKPKGDGTYISGGFFILNPKVLDLIEDDSTVWEQKPLQTLAQQGEMSAFFHDGFWQPMDTLRDKNLLEELWSSGDVPWKVWK